MYDRVPVLVPVSVDSFPGSREWSSQRDAQLVAQTRTAFVEQFMEALYRQELATGRDSANVSEG